MSQKVIRNYKVSDHPTLSNFIEKNKLYFPCCWLPFLPKFIPLKSPSSIKEISMEIISNNATLQKISKIINQLKKDEAIQLMNLHGDTVNKIRDLMKDSGISSDQLQFLLKTRQIRKKRIDTYTKKNNKKIETETENETNT